LASDRPIHRQAIKLLARVLLGGRRAHYHSWLPSLAIEGRSKGHPGKVKFRGVVAFSLFDIRSLSERAGTRILIIGSGPSVRRADLPSLPDRVALLLNGAISLIGEQIREPLAVAIEDERFVWRHFDLMRKKLARRDVPLLLSPGVIRAICELDVDFLRERPIILVDDIRKPYGLPRRDRAELAGFDFAVLDGEAGFSSAPDRGVFQGGSVAISALQFALATGAREVGFLGVDIANANAPRFYETEGDVAYSGIAGAEARILAHIALALDVAEARGVRLANHSRLSALRSIGLDYRPLDQTAS
jgi:hypothetical protein